MLALKSFLSLVRLAPKDTPANSVIFKFYGVSVTYYEHLFRYLLS